MNRVHALASIGLVLTGCASKSGSEVVAAPADERQIVSVGGAGGAVTAPFDVTGRTVRIAYRLSIAPASGKVTFVLEREAGGSFGAATSDTEIVPVSLSGSRSLPVIPGRYRLRVDADVSWTADIDEPRS